MPAEIGKIGMEFISELDERIFGKNTLSTRLFKYFLEMAIFILILPIILSRVFTALGIERIFYYISMPAMIFFILIFFILYSIKEILRPIKDLLEEVKKLQKGNLDIDVEVRGYVEIESLAKSVERMRNSLFIATSFLGKRDVKKDGSWRKEVSIAGLYLVFMAPFLIYGITLSMLGAVLYSDVFMAIFGDLAPALSTVLILIYGVTMAFTFGYLLSIVIGKPMRKLARSAEEATHGNMGVDFTVGKSLGYIYDLSIRLRDLKEAIKRAMDEMEGNE